MLLPELTSPDLVIVRHLLEHGTEGTRAPGEWAWEPTIIAGTLLFIAVYFAGVAPLRRLYHWAELVAFRQVFLFLLGMAIFFFALVSPLDVLSDDYLFSAHMVQHILINTIVPPLLIVGTPDWLLRPLIRPRPVRQIARVVTNPAFAFLSFNLVFWGWHWPPFYELAVADEHVHAVQHLSFVATGVLNWWPVASTMPELPRLKPLLRVFYLFACCQPQVALGALFVFSRDVLYSAYVNAPRLFDLSPLADQQLGGLIMWIPGNAVYLSVLSIVFLRWIQREEGEREPVR